MRHLVQIGDQKSIGIEVLIDADAVPSLALVTVIPKFAASGFGYNKGKGVVLPELETIFGNAGREMMKERLNLKIFFHGP